MPRFVHIPFFLAALGTAITASAIDFDRDVRPILSEHCASCHGGVKKKSGLSVLARDYLTRPNQSGQPAIVPGDAANSELIARIRHADSDERMPPEQPLDAADIATLTAWVDAGALWPTHWAHTPVADTAGSIDAPIDKKLAGLGITASPPAEPHVLLRRLTLDLTGLLPTADELAAFTADPDVGKAADRLLASPRFGERWARHWLDEARYADSEGYEKDSVKSDAYRFRDWVIKAINDDVPFDRFTASQIAGDLLPDRTGADLVATKFHLQTQYNLEGGVDAEEDRTKRVIDQVNTVGTTWLGTTVGCAQCHDHPYDEFTQRDFFSLYAFFNNTDYAADFLVDPPSDADSKRADRANRWSKVAANLEKQVTDKNLNNAVQGALSGMRNFDNSNGFTRYLEERTDKRRTTLLFRRGDFLQPDIDAGEIAPQTPGSLPPVEPRAGTADRLDLAHWLTSADNPLTARVTVNKVWARLFGRPLADQPHDFGARGTPPSHPQLLDHLARYFANDAAWSRKKLIRYIVTSNAYQRASHHRPDLVEIDPDNTAIARQNAFRAEAEVIRDIALQSSGLLHHKVGGPSVFPPLPAFIAAQTYAGSFKYKASTGGDRYRRGLYTFFRRTAIDPNLSTFDCPDSSTSQPLRDTSNNPLQALATLQNEVFHEAAQAFAKNLLAKHPERPRRLVREAYLTAVSRPPTKQESKTLLALYRKSLSHYQANPEEAAKLTGPHASPVVDPPTNAAWVATLRIVLNLDEFLTRS